MSDPTGIKGVREPMSDQRRFLLLALIMVGACAMVMAVMTVILYHHEVNQQRDMLQVTAQSQARLMEAIARHDAKVGLRLHEIDPSHDSACATVRQIVDGHEDYQGFGETGEFTLARRSGDSIEFVLRDRHGTVEKPVPIPIESNLAEPMRRALKGMSGTVIALDYRGKTVLAAHEPVAVLNLGIVAKIDLSEIRAPFIKSGLAAAGVALIVVLAGTALFFRVGHPILERMESYSRGLEQEVEERRRAESEREELISQLEAQNAELEQFTYTVSHDLKSPLITITGYAGIVRQALADGDLETAESDLAGIASAASKMNQLLADLLELSRIGRLVNAPGEVSLNELAHEAVELVSMGLKERGVEVDIATDLPEVYGDRVRILEVLQNLIENAVKYMGDQSHPRIEVGSRCEGNETICYVRDNGIGVDPVHHERIFGLFNQLNQKIAGTGIGLALVKRIVEVHGGRVWVESEGAGQGATFCFTLALSGVATDFPSEEPCVAMKAGELGDGTCDRAEGFADLHTANK